MSPLLTTLLSDGYQAGCRYLEPLAAGAKNTGSNRPKYVVASEEMTPGGWSMQRTSKDLIVWNATGLRLDSFDLWTDLEECVLGGARGRDEPCLDDVALARIWLVGLDRLFYPSASPCSLAGTLANFSYDGDCDKWWVVLPVSPSRCLPSADSDWQIGLPEFGQPIQMETEVAQFVENSNFAHSFLQGKNGLVIIIVSNAINSVNPKNIGSEKDSSQIYRHWFSANADRAGRSQNELTHFVSVDVRTKDECLGIVMA
ncbi:unnamed protein product [Protopolystoma xenopodis]|uniref:Uncharacterized protein n=1 Tax=Protopolystoma xenopodis TaxID=117903 RepID=A0A3S4ZN48_9PLAT|nr:unnamed protein product [Protopolystoma xenopodis]